MRFTWLWIGLAACGAQHTPSDIDQDTVDSRCDQWMTQGELSDMLDEQSLADWRDDPSGDRGVFVLLHLQQHTGESSELQARFDCAATYAAVHGGSPRMPLDNLSAESFILRGNLPATEELCSAQMVSACWFGPIQERCQQYDEGECLAHPPCWQLRGHRLSEDWSCIEKDEFASCMGGIPMALDWEVAIRGPAGRCWYFGYEPVGNPGLSYDSTCPDYSTGTNKPVCW